MGKVINEGWQKSAADAPQPTSPITILRDGTKVITLTIIEEKPKWAKTEN